MKARKSQGEKEREIGRQNEPQSERKVKSGHLCMDVARCRRPPDQGRCSPASLARLHPAGLS